MHSITDVIKHFKQNRSEELPETAIAEACCEAGMTWRETLPPTGRCPSYRFCRCLALAAIGQVQTPAKESAG